MNAPSRTGYGLDSTRPQRSLPARPRVVLSLDFELRWGIHDLHGDDFHANRAVLERVHEAVPALLKLFEAYGIRATWAAVGALGCESWQDYFARAPRPPDYRNPALQVKRRYAEHDPRGVLHFAPALIRLILSTTGQELGTHTFSHLYLREPGITAEDVAADLAAVEKLYEERYGTSPRSLVFPRNQSAFVEVVRAARIAMWRGNPEAWYYEREESERHIGLVPRAFKLMDGINPLRRLASPVVGDMTRASMFLRLDLPRYLWAVHLGRIKGEMAAAGPHDVFHLWFHPHNVARDLTMGLARVEEVIGLIAEKSARGGLATCSMGDLIQ